MSEYKLYNIQPASKQLLQKGIHLIILNADTVPPHIMLSINGGIYSLGVEGPIYDKPISSLWKYCIMYRKKTIFVELQLPEITTIEQITNKANEIIKRYPALDLGYATCLSPVKDFCQTIYSTPMENANYIFELLPQLEKENVIVNSMHLHLEEYLANSSFTLLKYNMDDINRHIFEAKSVLA